MKLHKLTLADYEDVVNMYYEFTKEVYPDRQIGERYFFYKVVMAWINERKDIVIVSNGKENVGFSMAYYDENGGLTEPIYNGILVYVKPKYRKTRAGYLLYKNIANYAEEKNLTLMASGRVENGVDKMIKKHFDCKEMFINLERTKK